jgi:hypothetical protein
VRCIALSLLGLTAGCGGKIAPSFLAPDAAIEDAPSRYAAECANVGVPPTTLRCTGLYADIMTKEIAIGVRAYAPAVPLWADYAEKQRWISLPPGMAIDATDPNEWVFPVGTKVWKEFSRDGERVETRFFQKAQSGFWVRTTYAWNADKTDATVSAGGDMAWASDGSIYHIPTPDECDQCHGGRTDRLLGFEQVSLGLAGASGLTVAELVAQQLIDPVPSLTNLTLGDDGTGVAAAPLEWLHINCGTTCHNDNANSAGYGASLRLRLDPTLLDGRASVNFATRTTTLGRPATDPSWSGQARIEPGDSTSSLLVQLITNRGTDNPVHNQMPPIATRLVDPSDTQAIIDWIRKMPPLASDGGPDSGDATSGPPDAGD